MVEQTASQRERFLADRALMLFGGSVYGEVSLEVGWVEEALVALRTAEQSLAFVHQCQVLLERDRNCEDRLAVLA